MQWCHMTAPPMRVLAAPYCMMYSSLVEGCADHMLRTGLSCRRYFQHWHAEQSSIYIMMRSSDIKLRKCTLDYTSIQVRVKCAGESEACERLSGLIEPSRGKLYEAVGKDKHCQGEATIRCSAAL